MYRRFILGIALAFALMINGCGEKANSIVLQMQTSLGNIQLELYPEKAPITVANFMTYVDEELYEGGSFYRVVYPENDSNPLAISIIQGGMLGVNMQGDGSNVPPITHESTKLSGLRHDDGAISMARGKPGSAQSEFFISLGENPVLDYGGKRNADGLGFAVFGRVIKGLDVVKAIQKQSVSNVTPDPYVRGQMLETPVSIIKIQRVTQ